MWWKVLIFFWPIVFVCILSIRFLIFRFFSTLLIGLNIARRYGQVSHLWFASNICAFLSRIFEGMYMSCKLASSLADFNVNFGTSTLRGMLQSTLQSLGSNVCLLFFLMHWRNWYCCPCHWETSTGWILTWKLNLNVGKIASTGCRKHTAPCQISAGQSGGKTTCVFPIHHAPNKDIFIN